eukprot:COSAG01_NODE_382_length_17840_cov_68.658663_4_plen_223_part_00
MRLRVPAPVDAVAGAEAAPGWLAEARGGGGVGGAGGGDSRERALAEAIDRAEQALQQAQGGGAVSLRRSERGLGGNGVACRQQAGAERDRARARGCVCVCLCAAQVLAGARERRGASAGGDDHGGVLGGGGGGGGALASVPADGLGRSLVSESHFIMPPRQPAPRHSLPSQWGALLEGDGGGGGGGDDQRLRASSSSASRCVRWPTVACHFACHFVCLPMRI